MGCSYLYPHVIPDPHVTSTNLTSDDTALVVANQGLWQFVSYEEAIREIKVRNIEENIIRNFAFKYLNVEDIIMNKLKYQLKEDSTQNQMQ